MADNVLLKSGLNPSTDFEPEYITVNAAAPLPMWPCRRPTASPCWTWPAASSPASTPWASSDHSQPGNELDANKEDQQANLQTENFLGGVHARRHHPV